MPIILKMKKKILISSVFFLLLFTSCDVVNQVSQMSNLAKCEFRLESVQHLNLAGIDVQNVRAISDLNLLDAGKLLNAVAANQFPLDFTLNVEAKNPNPANAGITKIDWILLIDDIEMTKGFLDKAITIPGNNATAIIPMGIHVDLKKALSGKSADAILNFGLNLAGTGNKPSRFTLQMKPTITVGGFPLTYPGYINVRTEFGSK
jgi:hypothetical protein